MSPLSFVKNYSIEAQLNKSAVKISCIFPSQGIPHAAKNRIQKQFRYIPLQYQSVKVITKS